MPVVSKKDRKALAVVFRGFEGTPTDYDPDVQAWLDAINAAGGSVPSAQADAVNAYWIIQKAAGLDLLAIADYPMVGDQIAMEHNLKAPGSFRLDFFDTEPSQFTAGGWKPGPRPVGQEFSGNANTRITYPQVNLSEADSFVIRFRGQTSSDIFAIIIGNTNPDNADQRGWNFVKQGSGNNNVLVITYFDQNGLRVQVQGSTDISDGVTRNYEASYNGGGFGSLGNFEILLDGVAEALSFGDQTIVGGSQPAVANLVAFNYDNRPSTSRRPWLGTMYNLIVEKNGFVGIDSLINEGSGFDIENTGGNANGVLSNPNDTFWDQTQNSFADTGLLGDPDTALNDLSLEAYIRESQDQANNELLGVAQGASARMRLSQRNGPNTEFASYNNDPGGSTPGVPVDANSVGQWIGSRVSDVDSKLFLNGIEVDGVVLDGGARPTTQSLYIGALNNAGEASNFCLLEMAGAGIYAGLTSALALQFFISRETMNELLNRSVLEFGGPLVEYIENVNRVGGSLTPTEILAVATYLIELSRAGIEPLADYPMLGGSEASHSISLFNNDDYELEFFGGWVHSATGALPDGSTAYANTKLVPFTIFPLGSAMAEYSSRTDRPGDSSDVSLGAQSNSNVNRIGMFLLRDGLTGRFDIWNSGEGRIDVATATSDGVYLISRIALDDFKVYKNGVLLAESLGSNIGTQPSVPVFIGARNNNNSAENFSNLECIGASLGPGLDPGEAEAQAFARIQMNEIAGRA